MLPQQPYLQHASQTSLLQAAGDHVSVVHLHLRGLLHPWLDSFRIHSAQLRL